MKTFHSKMILLLVASLALGTGTAHSTALESSLPQVQFTARTSGDVAKTQASPDWTVKTLAPNQWEVTTSGNDGVVNFLDAAGNILLHFNPRPHAEGNLVMNSTHHGGWGAEERLALPDFAKQGPITAQVTYRNGTFGVLFIAPGGRLRLSADGACGEAGIETTIPMVTADCNSMGGTVMNAAPWGWADCRLDLCEDGDYALAGASECQDRAGYGIVGMAAGECRAIGGAINGNPADSQWTECHLDICEEGGLEITSPGHEEQKGYGIVHTSRTDCEALQGGMNPDFDSTKKCHLGLVAASAEPTVTPSTGQADIHINTGDTPRDLTGFSIYDEGYARRPTPFPTSIKAPPYDPKDTFYYPEVTYTYTGPTDQEWASYPETSRIFTHRGAKKAWREGHHYYHSSTYRFNGYACPNNECKEYAPYRIVFKASQGASLVCAAYLNTGALKIKCPAQLQGKKVRFKNLPAWTRTMFVAVPSSFSKGQSSAAAWHHNYCLDSGVSRLRGESCVPNPRIVEVTGPNQPVEFWDLGYRGTKGDTPWGRDLQFQTNYGVPVTDLFYRLDRERMSLDPGSSFGALLGTGSI